MTVEIESGAGGAQSLTHARIGWQNLARGASIAASTTASGYTATGASLPDTYQFWQPTALPATWRADLGSAQAVDYCGVAAHDLATQGATLIVESSTNDSTWTERGRVTPSDDSAIMVLFPSVSARYWRVQITGSTMPTIGVIHFGAALAMTRPIFGGVTPSGLARVTTIRPNISEGGQWLGRSIERKGYQFSASWRHLAPSFVRGDFDTFVKAARSYPFFFAWRPSYVGDCIYASADGDIVASNMGLRDFMEVSIDMTGHGWDE